MPAFWWRAPPFFFVADVPASEIRAGTWALPVPSVTSTRRKAGSTIVRVPERSVEGKGCAECISSRTGKSVEVCQRKSVCCAPFYIGTGLHFHDRWVGGRAPPRPMDGRAVCASQCRSSSSVGDLLEQREEQYIEKSSRTLGTKCRTRAEGCPLGRRPS